MPDPIHCPPCCCNGNERCAFFLVDNPTDAPPEPTITISGVGWTFSQNGFLICSEACTGVIPNCGGTVVNSADISVVNGTYTGLSLAPLYNCGYQTEYGCVWQQSYSWFFGSAALNCGTLIPGGNPNIHCNNQIFWTGGTLALSVRSNIPPCTDPYKVENEVTIELELNGNMTIYKVSEPGSAIDSLGNLRLVWSTGPITVPKCHKVQPVIPSLTLVSSNLPPSATSGSSDVVNCGTANSFSSAGTGGTASVTWA